MDCVVVVDNVSAFSVFRYGPSAQT